VDYYPGRNVAKNDIRFSDDIIYNKLSLFRNMVFTKTQTEISALPVKNLMIVDRKYNRMIDPTKLQFLVQEATKNRNWNFTGVTILEDKTFKEQVNLFANHQIFIFRHGSCLTNLLWIPNNSIVFELEGGPQGVRSSMVIPRICKLTNSRRILLNYDNYDCKKDIFEKLII
jgi:capsular polysaccharide biosynthesis protein